MNSLTHLACILALLCTLPLACSRADNTTSNQTASPSAEASTELIQWLLSQEGDFKDLPFAQVLEAATGHVILPFDRENEVEKAIYQAVSDALNRALFEHNAPGSPTQNLRRINEASRYFEDSIQLTLDALPDFSCDFPLNASGKTQRSGYPDLRLVHLPSGRVTYLDPKLYEQTNRKSSLRTFYFEPKKNTNKVLDDAHHLLIGIAHDGKDGQWKFLSWELVDLHQFRVRLKAEFQASNRDLYRDELVLGQSEETKEK